MKVSRKTIASVIAEHMQRGVSSQQLAKALAQYLVQERRVRELDAIMREVSTARTRQYGVVEATLTTAEPLTENLAREAQKLIAEYTGHTAAIMVEALVDPSLIGGIKLTTTEFELDASVRRKLAKLKQPVSLKGSI